MAEISPFDGPIPGENFTSNPDNQPWKRPPDITDTDKGIELAVKQLTSRKGAYGLLNSLQSGITIVQATDLFVTSGIGQGKWSVDMGLVLAGPIAKVMQIMAEDAEIEYALGIDDDPIPTISYYKKQAEITPANAEEIGNSAEEQFEREQENSLTTEPAQQPKSGFMGAENSIPLPAAPIEQAVQGAM